MYIYSYICLYSETYLYICIYIYIFAYIVKPPVQGVHENTEASKNHYMYVFTKKHVQHISSNTSTN